MRSARPFSARSGSGLHDRPVAWRFRLGLFLLVPFTWLLQLAARSHPDEIERGYSRTVYPVVLEFVSTLTGWFRWSLAEIVLVLLLFFWLLAGVRAVSGVLRGLRSPRNVLAHFVSAVLAGAGVIYGWGMLGWGLNYHRQPLAALVNLDTSPVTEQELRRLVGSLATEAAALRASMEEDDAGVMKVADTEDEALTRASRACGQSDLPYERLRGGTCSRPKIFLLPILPWLGVGGIFSMFTSEPGVAHQPVASMLDSACHELAHQLGWAREEEASFVGHVSCRLHPSADYRYATTQSALANALRALGRVDREAADEVYAGLHPGVLRDWDAQRRFWVRYRTRIWEATDRVNDAFLKAQGQEAGIASYGLLVDLLIADQRLREAAR